MSAPKKYYGSRSEKYTDRAGAERTFWHEVGLELLIFAGDAERQERIVLKDHRTGVDILFFPPKPKKETTSGAAKPVASAAPTGEGFIGDDDLPF